MLVCHEPRQAPLIFVSLLMKSKKVDQMYFGNIVIEINLRDDISYSDLNDEEDEVCESELTVMHPTLVWNALN